MEKRKVMPLCGERSIIDEFAATLREKFKCEMKVQRGLWGVYLAIRLYGPRAIGRRNWRRVEK